LGGSAGLVAVLKAAEVYWNRGSKGLIAGAEAGVKKIDNAKRNVAQGLIKWKDETEPASGWKQKLANFLAVDYLSLSTDEEAAIATMSTEPLIPGQRREANLL
jgi:hypothetical protein